MAGIMDLGTVTNANRQFGLDLLKTISRERLGENLFISPFSISVAIALTHLSAKEKTAEGIEKALCWPTGKGDDIHKQFQAYLKLLEKSEESFSLSSANRIYLHQHYTLLQDFLDKTKQFYMAEAVAADFEGNAEGERAKINSWVEEQTQQKIKDLIPGGVLNNMTRLVLVNAIYFKGFWSYPFNKRLTKPRPFKTAPDQVVTVPTMITSRQYSVIDSKDLNCRALEMPYRGGDLSMVILLPNDDFGLQGLLDNIESDKLNSLLQRLGQPAVDKVELFLPKFEVTSSHSLKSALRHLGMEDAFNKDTADFSGMTAGKDLFVSEVLHKAFVKVDEEGTEAAAATAVMMALNSIRKPPEPFVVDHPFLFLIIDRRGAKKKIDGGFVLFMGSVVNPSLEA